MDKEQSESKSTGKPGDGGARQAKSETSGVAARSHEAAENIKDAAVEKLQSAYASAESMKGQAAERVRKLSSAVRKVGEHLRVEDQEKLAEYAAEASDRIEGLASYIDSADLGRVVSDTESFARRRSPLFFGGALVMGLAAGRFLRSSGASIRKSTERLAASNERPERNASRPQNQNLGFGAGAPRREGGASS
jgi:hypothetical protein